MRRVHRKLSRPDIEALRLQLEELVPVTRASTPQLLRMMRLIVRKSQAEYARMCGVAPRVLASVEAGIASPTVETLEKLVRPFGYRMGVVMEATTDTMPAGTAIASAPNTHEPPLRSDRPIPKELPTTHREPARHARQTATRKKDSSPQPKKQSAKASEQTETALTRALRKSQKQDE